MTWRSTCQLLAADLFGLALDPGLGGVLGAGGDLSKQRLVAGEPEDVADVMALATRRFAARSLNEAIGGSWLQGATSGPGLASVQHHGGRIFCRRAQLHAELGFFAGQRLQGHDGLG